MKIIIINTKNILFAGHSRYKIGKIGKSAKSAFCRNKGLSRRNPLFYT